MCKDPDDCSSEDLQVEDDADVDDDVLLLVEMLDTSMSVVRGRGCAHGETCKDCGRSDCNLDEVVMMSAKACLGWNHTFLLIPPSPLHHTVELFWIWYRNIIA